MQVGHGRPGKKCSILQDGRYIKGGKRYHEAEYKVSICILVSNPYALNCRNIRKIIYILLTNGVWWSYDGNLTYHNWGKALIYTIVI